MDAPAQGENSPAAARTRGVSPQEVFASQRKSFQSGRIPGGSDTQSEPRRVRIGASASFPASKAIPALPIAAVLFRALNEAGARYGIFQDLATLQHALAGRDDLDVLIDKQHYPIFCSIVSGLHGRRGVNLSSYDNVCVGREDWFVPDFSRGGYLHLDMHIGVRVGREFRKRYLAFEYPAIAQWQPVHVDEVVVPVASPEDAMRVAIARFAFRVWALPWRRWVPVPDGWKRQFARLPSLSTQQGVHVVGYQLGHARTATCRIRKDDDHLGVHRGDLLRLRRSIREICGFTSPWGIADLAIHLARKTSYLASRLLERLIPGGFPPKRRPAAGGLVVAVIGPDGVGKSTQIDRLTRVFRWKFGCEQAYVGTGEGRGWWLRKGLQYLAFPHRQNLKAAIRQDNEPLSWRSRTKAGVVATGLALWGILIAFERYAAVKRAHRMATRGLIVICDRWPQPLRSGYLDGPMIPPHLLSVRGLAALARLEQTLYRRMDECRPHVILHLVCDHAVSESRKPGEISKAAFDARLSLMAEMRERDREIRTTDASGSFEAVNAELFKHIWLSL